MTWLFASVACLFVYSKLIMINKARVEIANYFARLIVVILLRIATVNLVLLLLYFLCETILLC